jgi:hypothetical protein
LSLQLPLQLSLQWSPQWSLQCHLNFYLSFHPKFHSNTTSVFTSVFTPTLMMLSFYSALQTTAEHLFTFHSQFITHNTCYNSICRKRFEKSFLAEIYSLCASERLLIYLHPIFSQ